MLNLLAGADSSTRGAATQVAAGLEPGDRALEALPVVLIGRGDRLTGSRPVFPGLVLHDESVRTPVWSVNKMGLLIFKCTKTRRAPSRTACSSDLDAADVDLNPSWHTAELDPSALNGEIQTVAREVQARDLDALPQRGLDWSDPQPAARRIRLEPEQRTDHRERGGGAPVLRPAAGLVFLGRLSGRPLGAGEQLRQPAIRVLHPRLERGARHELRRGGEP